MRQVMLAQPYDSGNLGSFGKAEYMLIKQSGFPLNYDEYRDKITNADHDRLLMWDHDHFRKVCQQHLGTGELGIPEFARSHPDHKVMAFVKAALKHEEPHWTGFRITATVNRSNGYPVYTLELFANVTGVDVYSDQCAPNVRIPIEDEDGEGLTINDLGPYGEYATRKIRRHRNR